MPSLLRSLRGKASHRLRRIRRRVFILLNDRANHQFDVRHGTNTTGKMDFKDLDVSGESVSHGTGYQAVSHRNFDTVMRSLDLPRDSSFLDLGCGKGKAMLLAAEYPDITRIRGVELSNDLCEAARANIASRVRKHPMRARTEVVCADATTYDIPDDVNVLFMFNPFDGVIMEKVLANIARSLEGAPRTLWLIYCNPVLADLLDKSETLSVVRHHAFRGPGRDFRVYATKRPAAAGQMDAPVVAGAI